MTCYIFIYLNRDMVRRGRSRTVFTSVGRGSASPSTTGTMPPRPRRSSRDCLPVHAGRPDDRDRLPVDHASSATFPFFLTTRGGEPASNSGLGGASATGTAAMLDLKIDPGFASHYIMTLVHAHIPGPVDAWREIPVPVRDLLFDIGGTRSRDLRISLELEEGSSVRLWGQPRYYSSVLLICEFGRSSGIREFICCAVRQWCRGDENPHSGRATGRATDALPRYSSAVDLSHAGSTPLTANPSGQYYY
ncbi:hypothetical protein Taro_046502 [Colocasia esculenta]|uniref:Uncharacterized protein n=1 Tax=Colocasia esculenta TaxID=4460 RepID=A0A843WZB6_COLES|nr:hypothetical protein [Colocasia esculenta]